MAKKSTFCTNWQKYALQWGVLALLLFFLSGLGAKVLGLETPDPEKYCPFGGLQALTTFLVKGSLPCSMTTMQIMMGIALAADVQGIVGLWYVSWGNPAYSLHYGLYVVGGGAAAAAHDID